MWVEPKTDWYGKSDANGVYTGDYFNYTDFNRIKGNLEHLHNMAIALYPNFNIVSVPTKKVCDNVFADEINSITNNLKTINSHTVNKVLPKFPTYKENGAVFTFVYLNAIESEILEIYKQLSTAYEGRRQLSWNLGTKGDRF